MEKIIVSGFGGQGILTLGQMIANIAMSKGLNVTWIPSYGAEMRGGTANCSVVVSDKIIGNPMVSHDADVLIAMNVSSFNKFTSIVRPGGIILLNSSMIDSAVKRTDVTVYRLDATNIGASLGNPKVQNMVMLGGYIKATNQFTISEATDALTLKFGTKKPELLDINTNAVAKGFEMAEKVRENRCAM